MRARSPFVLATLAAGNCLIPGHRLVSQQTSTPPCAQWRTMTGDVNTLRGMSAHLYEEAPFFAEIKGDLLIMRSDDDTYPVYFTHSGGQAATSFLRPHEIREDHLGIYLRRGQPLSVTIEVRFCSKRGGYQEGTEASQDQTYNSTDNSREPSIQIAGENATRGTSSRAYFVVVECVPLGTRWISNIVSVDNAVYPSTDGEVQDQGVRALKSDASNSVAARCPYTNGQVWQYSSISEAMRARQSYWSQPHYPTLSNRLFTFTFAPR